MQGLSRELWLTVVYFIKPLSLGMKGFSGRLKKSWLRMTEKIQEMEVTETTQAATGSEWVEQALGSLRGMSEWV